MRSLRKIGKNNQGGTWAFLAALTPWLWEVPDVPTLYLKILLTNWVTTAKSTRKDKLAAKKARDLTLAAKSRVKPVVSLVAKPQPRPRAPVKIRFPRKSVLNKARRQRRKTLKAELTPNWERELPKLRLVSFLVDPLDLLELQTDLEKLNIETITLRDKVSSAEKRFSVVKERDLLKLSKSLNDVTK